MKAEASRVIYWNVAANLELLMWRYNERITTIACYSNSVFFPGTAWSVDNCLQKYVDCFFTNGIELCQYC